MIVAEPLTISLPGHPHGKGRARAFLRGGHISHYTPSETRSYESLIRGMAIDEMGGREPTREPVELTMVAVFDIPRSFSKKRQAVALSGELRPAKKPDLDNITKAITDGMNGVVFHDDCQIVRSVCEKRYGSSPMVVITVTPLTAIHRGIAGSAA